MMPTPCLSAVLASLWLFVGAAPARPPGQTYAVVVGIADYQALTYQTGDLRYADHDAERVVGFLTSEAGGSVKGNQLRLLLNQQATGANIRQALHVFEQATPADRVILYFSGHGLTNGFVPYDVQPTQTGAAPGTLLTYQIIKAAFRASKAGLKLCIADACLSGNLSTPTRTASKPLLDKPATHKGLTTTLTPESNVVMLLASRSTQVAIEDRRLASGMFTYYLLKGLRGEADQNGDRVVTVKELHRYVVPRVKKVSLGKQSPIFYGRFSDSLPLAYF